MQIGSKLRYFFYSLIIALLLSSCNRNENDVIPDVDVDFTIDMMDFFNIYGVIGSDTVNANDLRIDQGRLYAGGFKGNGIIIYYGGDGYYAYDRTCPHDYSTNGLSIKINADFTQAVCPKCSTIYALSAFGTPASGPGRYPLKNYKTRFDGRYLNVWNH
jgi:nitrite reductase/ring-hydroxylating ferredoxin subunit